MSNNKQVQKGKGNILIGGNIIFSSDRNPSTQIRKLIEEVDKIINEKYTLFSINREKQKFSSSKILTSLSELGIPIDAGIEVLLKIESKIEEAVVNSTEITTTQIRNAISALLYSLNPNKFPASKIQTWGDKYIRRYGSPDAQIKIIHENGEEENLSITYIKETLIPHLIKKVINIPCEEFINSIDGKSSIRDMANTILYNIKRLDLYYIRYKTLINIIYDLAIQPPHPWFVEIPFDKRIVEYDMEKSERHYQIIMDYKDDLESIIHNNNNDQLSIIRHSAQECIHHSCSAILAYYGLFMGVGPLKPLHNLRHAIGLLLEPDPNKSKLLNYSKIIHIKSDLKNIDQSIKFFKVTLDKTIKIIPSMNSYDIKHLVNNTIELYKIMKNLISKREEINKYLDMLNEDINVKNNKDFYNLCINIFSSIDSFKLFEKNFKEGFISFRHNINSSLFHEIKTKIIIIPLFRDKDIQPSDLKIYTNKIEMRNLNTIIFIINKKYDISCLNYIKNETKDKDINIILFRSFHLYDLFNSNSKLDKLEELILRNFDNISKGTFIPRKNYN